MGDKLTPAELQQYHAYATACECEPSLAAEVREVTRAEREAWALTTCKLPDDTPNASIMAYVAWQRAELREWERLREKQNGI